MTLLLTITEAAKETMMSAGYMKKEIREGRIQVRKVGRHTRIERVELERWIAELPVKNVGTSTVNDKTRTKAALENIVSYR